MKPESTLLSSCCGVQPYSNGDSDTSDVGICPECGDHCEYVVFDENGNVIEAEEEIDDGGGGERVYDSI